MARGSMSLRPALGALALAFFTWTAPAGAGVIASFSYPYGVGFGSLGDAQNFAPLFTVLVNGTPILTETPAAGDNVFELSGAALTTMATELADGSPDSYGFRLEIDSILHQFSLTLFTFEGSFTGAANLPGATIQGIRITLDDLCMQPTVAGGCAFPGVGWVGFGSTLLVEVSDTPFPARVPTPGTLALLLAGCAAALAATRRGARGQRVVPAT